ncbi:hypothetical protein [uncultured Roseibium sp.]|uniref:hypothetical protein n=1 Tax=uncultured Roseibium sp. TaxID=1936171 RepID=UPI00261F4233|nr:hypothetical protein [uncultured Roseibium sp.]
MRFLLRNIHILVFACFSVFAAVWVATGPDRAVQLARPMVEDAVELKTLATGAYREVRDFRWKAATNEFVTLYITAMRMPSLVFERLADRLDKFNDDLQKRSQSHPVQTPENKERTVAVRYHAAASARAMP